MYQTFIPDCNGDTGCIGRVHDSQMSVVKKMVLEAWTIPYDIFNLVLSLASDGLEIARNIYAPIITLAILPAHIAVTCFLDWEAV